MGNALSGDFDAVLQISANTIQRLLATMHQNAGSNTALPSFPSLALFRIGDDHPWHGVRGGVRVQIGVPRIELFDHVSDRFALDVDVRARYRADPGTKPLAEFIHGSVHAEYRLHDIDPSCPGWRANAGDFLWARVVKESVRFTGSALDDVGPIGIHVLQPDPAVLNARITQLIAALLATRFEAVPHPVSPRFRRGAVISVGGGFGAAVALPLSFNGAPSGSIMSIPGPLVNGRDIAVAIRREALLALAQPMLDAVAAFKLTVGVHVGTPIGPDIDTVYHVNVGAPSIQWVAGVPFVNAALFHVKVSGSATTRSILPNANFDIEQDVHLNFDAGAERLWLSPGARKVTTHSSGLGSGSVANAVNGAVHKAVATMVGAACAGAQGALDAMIAGKSELVGQLRGFDDKADAHFDDCEFRGEGIVLRGTMALSPRHEPEVKFEPTGEGDGYSAFLSWIPGGRIDRFEWSWTFFPGSHGAANHDDRFLLRRPRGSRSRWGQIGVQLGLTEPLPGLDGMGTLCLTISGSRIDPVSGAWVPVQARKQCRRYGVDINIFGPDLKVKLLLTAVSSGRTGEAAEIGVIDAGPRAGSHRSAGNTLVLMAAASREWNDELLRTLRQGLQECRREDAGLKVLLLLRGERAAQMRRELAPRIEELSAALGVMLIVDEDTQGSWSGALAANGREREERESWRLLAPGGGVTWMHDGPLEGARLAAALDTCLLPSAAPSAKELSPLTRVGDRIRADALRPDLSDLDEVPHCPPSPLGRTHHRLTVVGFVQAGSASSTAWMREMAGNITTLESDDEDAAQQRRLLLIVGGADREGIEAMKNQLGIDFDAIADPEGRLAERFGVRMWPTAVSVYRGGEVADVSVGWQRGDADKCHCD